MSTDPNQTIFSREQMAARSADQRMTTPARRYMDVMPDKIEQLLRAWNLPVAPPVTPLGRTPLIAVDPSGTGRSQYDEAARMQRNYDTLIKAIQADPHKILQHMFGRGALSTLDQP